MFIYITVSITVSIVSGGNIGSRHWHQLLIITRPELEACVSALDIVLLGYGPAISHSLSQCYQSVVFPSFAIRPLDLHYYFFFFFEYSNRILVTAVCTTLLPAALFFRSYHSAIYTLQYFVFSLHVLFVLDRSHGDERQEGCTNRR